MLNNPLLDSLQQYVSVTTLKLIPLLRMNKAEKMVFQAKDARFGSEAERKSPSLLS